MQVLVVEDEILIRMLVCELLQEAGLRCVEAGDAAEALALLEGGLCRPDILVTDYNLGPGMNGKELAREVLRRLPELPVTYVTGNPDCLEGEALRAGDRLLAKPFRGEDLVAAVLGAPPAPPACPGFPGAGPLVLENRIAAGPA